MRKVVSLILTLLLLFPLGTFANTTNQRTFFLKTILQDMNQVCYTIITTLILEML